MPVVGLLIIVNYRVHLQLLLLASIIPISLPRILVGRSIPLFVAMPVVVFLAAILRAMLLTPARSPVNRLVDRVMLVVTGATLMWIAVDRPGLGSLGAETGGAWEALMAISGLSAYWGARSLRDLKFHWRNLTWLLIVGSLIGVVWTGADIYLRRYPWSTLVPSWFFQAGWGLYGVLLGLAIKRWRLQRVKFAGWPVYAISCLLLAHSLLSGFRSRILFGPCMVGAALWAGRMRRQFVIAVLFFGVLCVVLANSSRYYETVPRTMQRVLSVVRPEPELKNIGLGEMGRRSAWRAEIWRIAWSQISQKPFIGHGYGIDSARFFADLSFARSQYTAVIRGVSTAGEFHNLPLNLMYFLGIPMALLFCVGWYLSARDLFAQARAAEGWHGAFMIGLLVYAVANFGQALANGTGIEYVSVCAIMGITQCLRASSANASLRPPPVTPADS
jgi:hypothetical protein